MGINKQAVCLQETIQYLKERAGPGLDEIKLARLVVGIFFTGVKLNTGQAGVAFTPIGEIPEAVCCPKTAARMPEAGKIVGRPVSTLLGYALDENVLKAAIGVAAVNALSQYLWQKQGADGYTFLYEKDALDEIDFTRARTVSLVGAFTPFIRLLKKMPCQLYILEKNAKALKADEMAYYRPPEAARETLAVSDVAILTGTTIVNHTIDELLTYPPAGCQVVLAGPTASMVPVAFFKRGVNFIGGIEITHPDKTLDILAEAGSAYHLFGRYARKMTLAASWGT